MMKQLNLVKPTPDDFYDIEVFNANSTAIEGAFEDLDERLTLCETEEERGTFTPTVQQFSMGQNQPINVTGTLYGSYHKRGKMCYVTIRSTGVPNQSGGINGNFLIEDGSGQLYFRGLPFIPNSNYRMTGVFTPLRGGDAGKLHDVTGVVFWTYDVGPSSPINTMQPLIKGGPVTLPLGGTNHNFMVSFCYVIN